MEDVRSGAPLLDEMVALQRQIAAAEAQLAAKIHAYVDSCAADRLEAEFATDEVAAALRWARRRVAARANMVSTLRKELPATWAAWCAGAIDDFKVAKIAEAADRLADPAKIEGFEAAAAAAASDKTWGQLQSWLNRKVALAGPKDAEARYRRAFAERIVQTSRTLDGMGWLWATTDALDLAAADHRLTQLAEALGADDPRTMDQRRTDVFVDLLLGRRTDQPATGGGESAAAVAVTVPIQSLVGVDDTPGGG